MPNDNPLLTLRVMQASLNQTAFDFPRNKANILAAIDRAAEQGADLLCFEELALTGYDAGDDFQKTDNDEILEHLFDIAAYAKAQAPDLLLSIGHPYFYADKNIAGASDRTKNALYNRWNLPFDVQSFIGQGRLWAMTAKSYLFGYERGYETRYFAEWSAADADQAGGADGTILIDIPGQKEKVPLGRPVLRWESSQGALHLAHVVCEEKWIASRFNQPHATDDDYARDGVPPAVARLAGKTGLVLIVPNASPPSLMKMDKHRHLAQLASNYAGAVIDTDGLGSSGSTFAQFGFRLIAQDGVLKHEGRRLSFRRVMTDCADIALDPLDSANGFQAQACFSVSSAAKPSLTPAPSLTWDRLGANTGAEETVRMAALWLFDYMRKTKSQGIAEAVSGGADSAFNATLVAIMVRLALTELGVEGFCQEMAHLTYLDAIRQAEKVEGIEGAIRACLARLLTCVYMGTNNSSDETRAAARFLVQGDEKTRGIGGTFLERNVQDLLDFYAVVLAVPQTSLLPPVRKAELVTAIAAFLNRRPGSATLDDLSLAAAELRVAFPEIDGVLLSAADPRQSIAYENIQARARQVLIMLIANTEGKMAIANPNLDEARNAYATFGGDLHSGTVNLNAFIPKARELEILRYLCEQGLDGFEPVASLALVLKNKPTAELLPKDDQGRVVQNDEEALGRSFAQMDRLSGLMLSVRAGAYKQRRLKPIEIFEDCQQDPLFASETEAALYNMICLSYRRWEMAQHKIHASPLAPTFGVSVDHQVSLRTPNLSGGARGGLVDLGLSLLFKNARDKGLAWPTIENEKAWHKRALSDEAFIAAFDEALRGKGAFVFDLEALAREVEADGLASLFGALPACYLAWSQSS